MPWLAAAAAGSAIVGSLISSSAAKSAAKTTAAAADRSAELQKQQYDQTRADLSPYTDAGKAGITALEDRASGNGGVYGDTTNPNAYVAPTYAAPAPFKFDESDYKQTDGYKFQLDRGLDAIQSSQASRGAMYSGATAKALAKFSQGLAAQDYNQQRDTAYGQYTDDANRSRAAFDADRNYDTSRYTDQRDYLTNAYNTQTGVATNLANIGQSAAAGVGNAGANYATNAGNAYQAAAAGSANAAGVAASNTVGLIGQGLNAYAMSQQPGVVDTLSSGKSLPKANSAINSYYGYA